MTDLTLSHRQPVAPTADVARGPQPPKAASDATGGVRPRSPAGTPILFAVVSMIVTSPIAMWALGDGRIIAGKVYGAIAAASALLFILETLRESIDIKTREARQAERESIAKLRAASSFMRITKAKGIEADMAGRVEAALARAA